MNNLNSPDSANTRKPKKQNWFLPIIVAFIVALWSVTLAMFFLVVIWALRLNPKSELSLVVTDVEKKICAVNYRWLRNSSFITIPVFIVALLLDVPPTLAALLPFIFHFSLIRRLKTESLYVYRHTQQSLLMLLLRATSASIIFYIFDVDEGFWLFALVNGSLWLFGTNWIIVQVNRNTCWLMERKGEKIILSENARPETINHPIMDKELAGMLDSLNADSIKTAKEKALHAFQTGTPTIKKRAIAVLVKLGEVEKF